MSYTGYQGYGGYYPQNNDQGTQGQYNTNRQTPNTVGLPDPSGTQAQYGQDSYGWNGQAQPDYTDNGSSQTYAQGTWRTGQDGTSFNYSKPPTYNTAATTAPPSSLAYYSQSSQPSTQLSTSALNSLAYASGLESAGVQGNRTSKNNTPVNTGFPSGQSQNVAPQRLRSPAQTTQQTHSRSVQNPQAEYRSHSSQSQRSSATSTSATLSAAAARYQQQKQQQQHAHQSAPVKQPQSTGIGFPTSNYRSPASNLNSNSTSIADIVTDQPRSDLALQTRSSRSQPLPQTKPQPKPQPMQTSSRQYGKVTPSEIHRRANEAIFDGTARAAVTDSSLSAINTSMPSFINPSEVFNPYHYELEKKRREEETQASVHSNPPTTDSAQSPQPATVTDDVTLSNEPNDTDKAVNVKEKSKKPRKPRQPKARKSEPGRAPPTGPSVAEQSLTPQPTKPPTDDMANEMRSMIEKMREWKSKDPKMFQVLWEDMKKGSGSTSTSTAPETVQAAVSTMASPEKKATASEIQVPTKALNTSTTFQKPGPIEFSTRAVEPATPDGDASSQQDHVTHPLPSVVQPAANTSAKITWKETTPGQQSAPNAPSPMLTQSSPTCQSGGAPIWPVEKRKALADAAATALNGDPANAGKHITPETIQQILAENPNYIELCIRLERMGLVFNRGNFARFLLNSVPDLTSASQKPSPATVSMQSPLLSSSYTKGEPSIHSAPSPDLTQNQKGIVIGKSAVPQRATKKSASTIPEPPPGSKAAMARKRDFSEIVDLSQLSDYEDDDPVLKQPMIESPKPEYLTPTVLSQPTMTATIPPFNGYQPVASARFTANPSSEPYHVTSGYPPPYPHQHQPKKTQNFIPIVKSLDQREAAKKAYYNPKTVARDILIAAGRHPSERPLNYHLSTVMVRVPSLLSTYQADLSTFDWDTIDPGGPPMPRVEEVEMDNAPPRFQLGARPNTLNSAKGGQRGEVASTTKSSTANAILATQLSLPSNGSQSASGSQENKRSALPSRLSDVINAGVPKPNLRGVDPSTPQRPQSGKASSPSRSMTSGPSDSGRRRGRPPGSKTKHLSSHPQTTSQLVQVSIPEPAPSFPTFRCQWRHCSVELHNLATLRKHVAKLHSPKNGSEEFECWWRKCRLIRKVPQTGELQTMEQFDSREKWMNHVEKEHLNPLARELGDGPSDAHVGKTNQSNLGLARFAFNPDLSSVKPAPYPVSSSGSKTQLSQNADPQILEEHRRAYTSDPVTGRQVTPISSIQTNKNRPLDAMVLPVDRSAHGPYLKTHAAGKGGGKHVAAQELFRAIKWRKEQVGPGIDKGGATLVTSEMRATLLEDENIAMVVEDDEDSDDGDI